MWLRFRAIQIGARFINESLRLRKRRAPHGLDFTLRHNAALHKLPNDRAKPGAASGHASSDPANH
jgi:hypothetical protein